LINWDSDRITIATPHRSGWFQEHLYLPQVKAQNGNAVKLVHGVVSRVLWVVDLWVNPGSLEVRVVDLLGLPLALGEKEKHYS
jgi:hypothetical protein